MKRGIPILFGALFLILSTFPAHAQERKKTWELGLYTGLIQFSNDGITIDGEFAPTFPDADFVTGVRVGYNISNHWMVEAVWDNSAAAMEAPYEDTSIDYNAIQVNGVYNFRNNIGSGVDPYIMAGFGLNDIEVEGTRFDQSPPLHPPIPWLPYDNNTGTVETTEDMLQFALGLRVWGTENFGFRFELKQKRYNMWETETSSEEFTFGLMWSVGRPDAAEIEEEIPLDLD
jgi:hypothetical protein